VNPLARVHGLVLVCMVPSLNPEDMQLKTVLLLVAIAALYALHQDVWFWRAAHPLVFGFLPIGLAYHAVYCVAAALLMWALTRTAWPRDLEQQERER
jgi:hypothetical protein